VAGVPALVHLTLFGNPLASNYGYRHFFVNTMTSLLALDRDLITDEERIIVASARSNSPFKSLSKQTRINIPQFIPNMAADEHLLRNEVDFYCLKRLFERVSPVLRIQSAFKGYL